METTTNNSHQVVEAVDSLRREVALLSDRMSEVERRVLGRREPIESTTNGPSADTDLNDELILAISAAVAAYLGVKPHIRQIRLLPSAGWMQQGRVTIQASREFAVHHG